MSESDQFRQYAEEALLWAAQSKTEKEKQLLLELVRTWTQAAVASEVVANYDTGPLPAAISGTAEARSHAVASWRQGKAFDTVDPAMAHADQLAAKLGRNRSAHEIDGRFVRVTDEDGEEIYRAPLTNRS